MQLPPILFSDLSLLLAVGAMVLLITAELSSSYYGQTNFSLDSNKLKNVAYATGIAFLVTAVITVIQILLK